MHKHFCDFSLMENEIIHNKALLGLIRLLSMYQREHDLMWSHGEADVNKTEVDMVQQLAVVTLYSEIWRLKESRWENIVVVYSSATTRGEIFYYQSMNSTMLLASISPKS